MVDLTVDQVRGLLAAQGIPATQDDVVEVAHRVNALREALEALQGKVADAAETLPVFWGHGEGHGD